MNTHALVTFDDTHFLLTADDHARLMRVGDKDFFKATDGSLIRGSSIKSIMPIKSFYEKYPDRREPAKLPELSEEYRDLVGDRATYVPLEKQAEVNQRRLKSFVKGLQDFVDRNGGVNARALLAKAKGRYETLYGATQA